MRVINLPQTSIKNKAWFEHKLVKPHQKRFEITLQSTTLESKLIIKLYRIALGMSQTCKLLDI